MASDGARAPLDAAPAAPDAAPRRRGFTLIELVLVLVILAILAGVAMRSMSGLQDQARYEATQRLLTDIEVAVDGDTGLRQPDGSRIPNGFVADLGRLPALVGADPKTELQELWMPPAGVATYAIRAAAQPDGDVQLGSGWRGPYLRLPPGQDALLDGWGNALALAGTPAGALDAVQSPGADAAVGAAPGDPYAADLPSTPLRFASALYSTAVALHVQVQCESGITVESVGVSFFDPDPATGAIRKREVAPSTQTADKADTWFMVAAVAPGPRAAKVGVGYTVAGTGAATTSTVRHLNVPRGGLPETAIEIRVP
jgi:prepilin-type N-terminal cleavage/methylation domain-containing protein